MKLKIRCDWCGKEFTRSSNHVHDKNYCCRACLGKANAERFRLKSLKLCGNCGKIFEYRGHHHNRNKHFFCSAECSYEFKVKKIYVSCNWCGKPVYKKRSDVERSEHNFCDYGCYIDYVNFEKAGADNQMVSGEKLYRRLAEMKIGRKLHKNDEVHHIDGNHKNNNLDNLMVITASEHMKIHATKKERDNRGRFIKKE